MTSFNFLSSNASFLRLASIIALFSIACLIPFIGLFFLMMLPMVLYVLCFLNNLEKTIHAWLAVLGMMLILLFLMNNILPLLALTAMGMAGILMAWMTRNNYAIELLIILPSLAILGAVSFYLIYGGLQLSMSPGQLVEKYITEAVELNMEFYSRMPLNPEEITALQENKPSIIALFIRIFPAIGIISILFTIWINFIMVHQILRKTGVLPQLYSTLSEWSAPPWFVWIFIAAGGLSFIAENQLHYFGINVLLVASFVYLLQGLAIVSFFFQKKNISMFFRWLVYFLIAIQQMLMIAIVAVGFFDLWVDFRKYFRKEGATE